MVHSPQHLSALLHCLPAAICTAESRQQSGRRAPLGSAVGSTQDLSSEHATCVKSDSDAVLSDYIAHKTWDRPRMFQSRMATLHVLHCVCMPSFPNLVTYHCEQGGSGPKRPFSELLSRTLVPPCSMQCWQMTALRWAPPSPCRYGGSLSGCRQCLALPASDLTRG